MQNELGKEALFLSRIHEKKGIELLVKAWTECENTHWVLTIAGPDESNLIKTLFTKYNCNNNSRIRYVASVS